MTQSRVAKPVVYLAGPEVFLPNALEIGKAKVAICRQRGFEAIFPFEPLESTAILSADRGHEIFLHCVAMMKRCTMLIANMTPFRGVSMDVGTAVEIGYMYSRGHPILGYTNVIEDYDARVSDVSLSVESFGFADNLMCEGPVWNSGGSVIRNHVKAGDRLTDLRGFTMCVDQAVALLGVGSPATRTSDRRGRVPADRASRIAM